MGSHHFDQPPRQRAQCCGLALPAPVRELPYNRGMEGNHPYTQWPFNTGEVAAILVRVKSKPMRAENPIMRSLFFLGVLILGMMACGQAPPPSAPTPLDRYSLLPKTKYTPAMDFWPPQIIAGWSQPVPLTYPVNTSGGEDSPFITPDGQTLYLFFTPDVSIPAGKQLLDGVTGIWVTHRSGETWSQPERIRLEDRGQLALDGCEFVLGDSLWFCSIRSGNYRSVDLYVASIKNGQWTDWHNAGLQINQEYQVGEMHLTADGRQLYFASQRAGGFGGYDLWVSGKTANGWGQPVNLGPEINTSADENRPFVSADGKELWFDSSSSRGRPGPAIYLSGRQADGSWGPRQEIVSTLAGEPTLSGDGKDLYFVHHYFSADFKQMLEADIYITHRLTP